MKLYLQTRLTPLSTIYDTDAPDSASSSSGMGKIIRSILKPYAIAKQGDYKLLEYGKPYADESAKWQALIGLAGALVIVSGVSLIFGLGRLSK